MTGVQRMPRTQLFAITAALILVAELFANEVLAGDDPEVGGWLALSAFGIAITAILLFGVLPRVSPQAHPTLSLSFGITALITCVAFWSALPFAFGAGAIAASADHRPNAPGAILGAVAMLLALVACIIG